MADASAVKVVVTLNGKAVEDSNLLAYTVERDMYQPDMAQIVLSNQGDEYTTSVKVGDPVEIKVGDNGGTSVYKGEVTGLEPVYKGGEKTKVVIRAMNKFHRLLRVRKSITYTDKSDQQILQQVVSESGLSLDWKHDKTITYKHVFQHNQSAMEFLRTRAARLGCHVWCVDTTIHVKQPDLQSGEIATLNVDADAKDTALREFRPRLNSSAIVKKVTVKGWNPEKKELITGEASAQSSPLGSQNAVAGAGPLAGEETFTVDHPIWSKEEADALAKARLQDLSLQYITGEAIVSGDPKYDLGKVVKINANSDPQAKKGDDPFNGKYYVMGLTHTHTMSKDKGGGYLTILRLARDAQKGS